MSKKIKKWDDFRLRKEKAIEEYLIVKRKQKVIINMLKYIIR
tara:strand:- start:64 stop:189 length:126 start_codon:yes stop_codon:yes gene_type:complete